MADENERASDIAHQQADPHPIPNMISSSISGPGIGDDVASKRANLLNEGARGEPQTGRRETPDPYDPRPTRMMYLRGILSGAAVIVIVIIILVVVGSMNPVT